MTFQYRQVSESGCDHRLSMHDNGKTKNFCWCCRRCSSIWTYLKSLTFLYQSWGTSSTKFTTTITKCHFITSDTASAWRKWQVYATYTPIALKHDAPSLSNCDISRFNVRFTSICSEMVGTCSKIITVEHQACNPNTTLPNGWNKINRAK